MRNGNEGGMQWAPGLWYCRESTTLETITDGAKCHEAKPDCGVQNIGVQVAAGVSEVAERGLLPRAPQRLPRTVPCLLGEPMRSEAPSDSPGWGAGAESMLGRESRKGEAPCRMNGPGHHVRRKPLVNSRPAISVLSRMLPSPLY